MSTSELKIKITKAIKSYHVSQNELHLLLQKLNEHALNVYISIIKSQDVFNIFNTVSNKSESRSTAK